MKALYTAEALATGAGRNGQARLADGSLDLGMAIPQEMGGSGDGANPEQLFALGYAACFDSAMEIAAKQLKLSPEGARTSVAVGIGQQAAGGYALDLDITAHLPGMDDADAQKLVEATHQLCPYSNATRGNIDVRLHIDTAAA